MALLDENRLLPIDPTTRTIARDLYEGVKALPIISPHGHTDPCWYAENAPFPDPGRLTKHEAPQVAHDLAYRLAKNANRL